MTEYKKHYDQTTIIELQKWLENLYVDEPCPLLQPEEHNIELLLKLKARNEEAEKNVSERIKANKHLSQIYDDQNQELENLLKSEGVHLSEETMKKIESIAGLAMKLDLEKPDETSFLLAICNLKNNQLKKQEEKLKTCFTLTSLSKKIIKIQEHNENLKKELEDLEKIVEIQNSRKEKVQDVINMGSKKLKNYIEDIQTYENKLSEREFEPSLTHRYLVSKSESVKALEKEVQALRNKLESYKALPPNHCLAKLEVAKKRNELVKLEEEFLFLLAEWEKKVLKESGEKK